MNMTFRTNCSNNLLENIIKYVEKFVDIAKKQHYILQEELL